MGGRAGRPGGAYGAPTAGDPVLAEASSHEGGEPDGDPFSLSGYQSRMPSSAA